MIGGFADCCARVLKRPARDRAAEKRDEVALVSLPLPVISTRHVASQTSTPKGSASAFRTPAVWWLSNDCLGSIATGRGQAAGQAMSAMPR